MLRALTLLVVLVCAPAVASAQVRKLDQFEQTVYRQLRAYESALDAAELTHEVWLGSLRDDARESVTVELEGGVDYIILAVCDEDCDDVDLRLYEGTNLVDEDVAGDDYPVVGVTPSSTRTYRLEPMMASCSVSPCRYGVAIYSR